MHLRVNGLSGFVCSLSRATSCSIAEVKSGIQSLTGIPCIQQKVVCDDRELEDEELLESLVPDNSMEVERSLELVLLRIDPARAEALHAVRCNGLCLETLPEELRGDRDIVLAAVKNTGFAVIHAHPELRSDREIALASVSDRGFVLRYLEDSLKADRGVVLAAVGNDGFALRHASDGLRADREVALRAVRTNGSAVQYVGNCLAQDREIALAAVSSSGAALRYVAPVFRRDRDVVLAAVRSCGQALKFIEDERLREDPEVALAAVRSDFTAFQHVPFQLKTDRTIALAAVKQSARIFKSLPETVKSDREVALAAVQNDGFLLNLITQELQHDRDIVLAAVSNSAVLGYACVEMQEDREVVLAAVRHEGTMLQYSSGKLKSDAEVVLTAVKHNGFAVVYADGKLRCCREVMLEAVRNSGSVLQWAPEELKMDLQVALAAVASNPAATKFVSEELKKKRKFWLAALRQNIGVTEFLPKKLRRDQGELGQGLRKLSAEAYKKLDAEKQQLVAAEIQQVLPQVLHEVMQSKAAELKKLLDAGAQEWKEKYSIECDRRRKLHNLVQELKGNIRVYCRVRPMTDAEAAQGCCIAFPAPDEIQISNPDLGLKKSWQFNEIYRQNSQQEDLFSGIRDLVVSMLDGYNVCMFAYGQTGSGKTFSMQGSKENPGVYTRTFSELFKVAKERIGWKIELKGACVEIYNEEIRDLLLGPNDKKQKLQVRQGKEGNFVPGLTMQTVHNVEEVEMLLNTAQMNRTVAATDMNLHSSRSHLAVQILGTMTNPDGKQFSSAITLVDLAGSERLAKSGVSGDRAKEAIAINKSLSALGDVIAARAQKNAHTPYRNSILTHFLQDSLGGDSKTLMLLQINPCASHVEESMCSLTFGARVNAVEMKKS
ncbi:unnamed protein product [Effrenium voratum]|nr:unnamed protein product [Effrenium voratum]